jgi:hypothetical protein
VAVALLAGMSPLITLVGAPLWTGIADTTRRHRLVMSLTIAVAVVLALIFPTLDQQLPAPVHGRVENEQNDDGHRIDHRDHF